MNSTPEAPKALTDAELAAAFLRVSKIFADGCDRCDGDDLALLEEAGLMRVETCRDTFGHDTLEVGEPMWGFIPQVETLRTIFEATIATQATALSGLENEVSLLKTALDIEEAALAEARNDALGWRPIETYDPNEGTCLIVDCGIVAEGHVRSWDSQWLICSNATSSIFRPANPTHWRRYPAPPVKIRE